METGLDKRPDAHVLVLFLGPLQLGVGVLVDLVADQVERERANLLDAGDGHGAVQSAILAGLLQLVVDLAGAENDLANGFRLACGVTGLRDDSLEPGRLDHVVKRGFGFRVTEQALRGEDDERLTERHGNLAAEDVEIIGRSRAVGHNHVCVVQLTDGELFRFGRESLRVFRAGVQETLRTSRRVFRTHTFFPNNTKIN